MKINPLHDRVVIKRLDAEEKTAGGIYIPDTAAEKPSKGEVVAVGPGKTVAPMTVKTGDKVLFGKYAGTEVKDNGEELIVMREDDIIGVLVD